MTSDASMRINSEAEFFAHMIALKHDTQERLQLLSDCMTEHNNPQAASVFEHLLGHINDSVAELESMAGGLELPDIAPWEYQWNDLNDSNCIEQAHYLMSGRQSMQLVLSNEQRSLLFLQRVNQQVRHPQVKRLSQQLLQMELAFLKRIEHQLEASMVDDAPVEDLDPPNIPE